MTAYVLDTNIVSFIMRRDADVKAQFDTHNIAANEFILCPTVWYEVRRGLIYRDAKNQLNFVTAWLARFSWQDYTREDWRLAAETWARLRASGRQMADADLLIAVFALNRNAVLVTDNTADFAGLPLTLDNWKTPPAAD
jgi:predicted nucleic acid-binding protein